MYVFSNFLNRVISVISPLLEETTLIVSDSTGETASMEYKTVRVVSSSSTKISEITRSKTRSLGSGCLKICNKRLNHTVEWSFYLQQIFEVQKFRFCSNQLVLSALLCIFRNICSVKKYLTSHYIVNACNITIFKINKRKHT